MIIDKFDKRKASSPLSDGSSSGPSSPRSVQSSAFPFRDPKSPSDSREISQMHTDENLDIIANVIFTYLTASDEDKKTMEKKVYSNPTDLIRKINRYSPSDLKILKDMVIKLIKNKVNKLIKKSQEDEATIGKLIASFEKILDDTVETTREQSRQLRLDVTSSLLGSDKNYLLDSRASSPGSSPAKRSSSLGSSPAKGSSSLGSSHSQSARSPAPIKSLFSRSEGQGNPK